MNEQYDLRLNAKPAIKITASRIRIYKENTLFDCEGDEVWFPNKCVKYDHDEKELLVEQWLYDAKVEEGLL